MSQRIHFWYQNLMKITFCFCFCFCFFRKWQKSNAEVETVYLISVYSTWSFLVVRGVFSSITYIHLKKPYSPIVSCFIKVIEQFQKLGRSMFRLHWRSFIECGFILDEFYLFCFLFCFCFFLNHFSAFKDTILGIRWKQWILGS